MSKITVKRLSASDLTLFDSHFQNTPGTKQKAFNLDRVVLVDTLYPSLPGIAAAGQIPVSLSVHGPGLYGPAQLMRKVLKQQKNWRLDGETIHDPAGENGRFDALQKGDFAILEFVGDAQPTAAQVYLVAAAVPEDAGLHSRFADAYGAQLSPRQGMLVPEPEHLAQVIANAGLPPGHPVLALLDADSLEDAVQGGLSGLQTLKRRRGTWGVSKEEFAESRRKAERIGRLGEELLNEYFGAQRAEQAIRDFAWVADQNPIAPYDFTVQRPSEPSHSVAGPQPDGGVRESQVREGQLRYALAPATDEFTRYVDAKSTSGSFDNPIHISTAELHEMARCGENYDIYRLYEVREGFARLRIAIGVGDFAQGVVAAFSGLPPGVTVDGVSVRPASLPFRSAPEVVIDYRDTPDGAGGEEDPAEFDE